MQLSQSGGPDPQKQTTPAQPGSDKAAASGENDAQHIIDSIIGNFCTKESNLCERLGARLLQELQHRDPAVVAEMRNLARQSLSLPPIDLKGADLDPANINEAHVIALGDEERALIIQRMLEKAAQIFPADEVARIATEVLTQDRRPSIADLSQLASGTVYIPQLRQAIREFFELPKPEAALDEGDLLATRSGLISKLVSDDPRFLRIAQHHITVEVVRGILDRSVGFDSVSPIGGKAAGMILANLVVKKNGSNRPENSLPIAMPTSRFIRADVVEAFFDCNGLDRFHRLKFKEDPNEIRAGYEELRSLLVSLKFPGAIWDKLGKIVSAFGVSPIVVRSSSLLEDRLGTAFAGKYKSVFLANQGTHEDKLLALVGAVMEVYASTVSPDAILYRKQRDLLHFREQMGILIQNAVGTRVGRYFFPAVGGVAFSRNEYCWTPRIKREDGCLRLVMGLGTRAVDRGEGSDFCRFVPLGAPTLRPQADSRDIAKYCQRGVDVIDLESGKFTCVTLDKILEQGEPIPHLSKLVQVLQSGHLRDGFGEFLTLSPGEQPKITLEGIVKSDEFIGTMRWVLSSLESAFQCPVDVEFAFDGRKLHILQCRPQAIGGEEGPVTLPGEVSKDSTVLEVHSGLMRSVRIEGIKYAVYVSPSAYDELPSKEERVRVARLVGEINNRLPKRSFALIGPGRWGSNDVKLGVPVTYADILNTCLLVEVGHEKSGRLPELSYGTHFFQDLVESRIAYVPVFPGKSGSLLNEQLLEGRPNEAARILGGLSQYEGLEKVVRVIDLEAALGKAATLYIDSEHANKGILCSV